MTEWFDNLTPLDGQLNEFADDLAPLMEGPAERDLDDVTQDKYRGLDADLSYLRRPRVRSFIDLRAVADARDHVKKLPEDGETQHGVISGRYHLFALVSATLELAAPAIIDELYLITLSYSKHNAADLIEMLDAGRIKSATVLVSHYFAHANPHLYDPLEVEMRARKQRMLALRTHAKIIMMKLSDGRCYVVESSANARSNKNIEQWTFTHDAGLYDFHRKWVEGLFSSAAEVNAKSVTR